MAFDLEQALKAWRKRLNKYQGFEPGNAEELLSHTRDAIDDLIASGMNAEEAFKKVTQDRIGDLEKLSQEYYKAKSMKSNPTPRYNPSLATNFLKVAFRNIAKSRPHSYINLAGLAIGLASVIVISVYIFSELSFDRFHQDHEQIYRVVNKVMRSGTALNYPQGPPGLAPALTANFPELEHATRLRTADRPLIKNGDVTFYEDNAFYADSAFLRIFDFEILKGNRRTALNQPNTIVLTASTARKYFGNEDPIGKIVLLDGTRPLQVTAIAADVPHNSHLSFDVLISFQTYIVPEGYLETLDSWVWMGFITYAKTHEGVDIPALEQKISDQYKKGDARWADMNLTVDLQPLSDIYLGSTDLYNPRNMFKGNSYTTLYSLLAVGVLIILIASFNYVNLSIAMAMSRFKEIAMRKVLGSTKGKLLVQFILESVLYTLIALVAAVVLVVAGVRLLPDDIGSQIYIEDNSIIVYGFVLFAFTCFIGMISGLFPALRLSSITSLELLRGTFKIKGHGLRNVLIGFQFALSASLISISLVIGKQIEFFQSKDLGFVKEGVVSINISSEMLEGKSQTIINMINDQTGVSNVSLASHLMGEGFAGNPMYLPEQQPEEAIQIAYLQTDEKFLQTMGLELVAGRFFSKDIARDSSETIVLNETAVKTLGLTNPIGKRVVFVRGLEREIVGVVRDFHYGSLHEQIGSMAIIEPYGRVVNLAVRMEGDNVFNTLRSIESQWRENFPDVPFEYQFQDELLQSLYQKETLFGNIIRFFSILATGIACLGLYSLAAISLAGKVKQISIRRVLGAPIQDILVLSAKNFVVLVVLACIISWPLVMYVMDKWLAGFAYHIDVNAYFFVATFITIMVITLVTLSYHLFKAITVNPAETLRDN
ncbi:MAG: ABC transporter permease [Cyclobacteriaceae bacterium]|nr:ABC transporter permease [Cyclobacteriaceae bacterium]